jgi:hypothetical protein
MEGGIEIVKEAISWEDLEISAGAILFSFLGSPDGENILCSLSHQRPTIKLVAY